MNDRYYFKKLAADRLKRVYDLAPPRIQQYLRAELDYTLKLMPENATVLELGCGYGRVLKAMSPKARLVVGIDSALSSLELAKSYCVDQLNIHLACMDASRLAFRDGSFDVVVCIQNGVSAFHVDQRKLIGESMRVMRPGGLALFSSYAEKFWDVRLDWFEKQSLLGLVGEIDYEKTGNGFIVCKDGFTATTATAQSFRELTADLDADFDIVEVDESSLFCVIRK